MSEPLDIIYDGTCRFCVRVLAVMRRLDVGAVMRLHDSHVAADLQTQMALRAGVDLAQAMIVIDRSGTVYSGFFAFRRLVRGMPVFWPLLPLFYWPGTGVIGPRVYAWVARNRRSLGCTSQVCDVPSRRDGASLH